MSPLISIVMPAYRCANTLAESVQSAMAQTYDNWELVISIDDGEDYAALLAKHDLIDDRIRFVDTGGMGTGSSNARNVGVAAARSNYIAVLDADDLFTADKLEISVPYLKEHPLISTGLQVTDSKLAPLRQVGVTQDHRILPAGRYKWTNLSMDSMILYDRERLPIEYDKDQPCLVDLDLILKAFCHTDYCYHVGLPLHLYRKQAVSISNGPEATDKFAKIKRMLIKRIESKYYEFADFEKSAAGFLQFLQTSLATELQFTQQSHDNPGLLFEDLLESRLSP